MAAAGWADGSGRILAVLGGHIRGEPEGEGQ